MGGGAMPPPPPPYNTGIGHRGLSAEHLMIPRSNLPSTSLSTMSGSPFKPPCSKCAHHGETSTGGEITARGCHCDLVFGPVPSRAEVEKAMSDLQLFVRGLSTSRSDLGLLQQILSPADQSTMLQSRGYGRICEAFRLLQTEPSIQKLVLSLSSDKTVWEAISNNKAVQDLRGSFSSGKYERPRSFPEQSESDIATLILNWILGITKLKIMELIENFVSLVNAIFQPIGKDKPTDLLEEKVRSSFVLSLVIILIVVATRIH